MTNPELIGPLDFDPAALKAKYKAERDRRMRPEGKAQYVGTGDRFRKFSEDPWATPLSREPIEDHSTVIVAGGGFGGLLMGARLREAGVDDVRIIEVAGDFGGTWYWNRYPGAMCDLEAHIYIPLLEELGYAPKHRYSYASELLEISQMIGEKYGLYEKACFQTSISTAQWVGEQEHWLIQTDRGDTLTSDYFVAACGRQSLPKLPNLPGIDEFQGHIFHSSRWDYAYTGGDNSGGMDQLASKRVGVIGTGATALQIVPKVAEDAKELVVFQRTPSTVGVRGQRETDANYADMSAPGWQRERRDNFQAWIEYGRAGQTRPETDLVGDGWTEFCGILAGAGSGIAERLGREPTRHEQASVAEINDYRLMNKIRSRVDEVVADPQTADLLQPWYRWSCKRPGFHDDYLAAFNRENVSLVDTSWQGIERFTEAGVVVGGVEYPLDCIVMATGFEAGITYTHLTGFEIEGDGTTLSEHWSSGVRTLHGLSTDRFPNLFFVGGNPQTVAAVNAVHLLDEQSQYVAHVIGQAVADGTTRVEALTEHVDDWVRVITDSPKAQAQVDFFAECTPGYFNQEGQAKTSADLFGGGRYADGALGYYRILREWVNAGDRAGFEMASRVASRT